METRRAQSLEVDSGKLIGYASVFDSPSQDLGGFVERVSPGAFKRSLADADALLALYNHDLGQVLGRVGAGTLRLSEDQRGLRYSIDLPDTTLGRDLGEMVRRGDVAGASFGFHVREDSWDHESTPAKRTLIDVDLLEVSVTALPAYPDATAAKRSLEAPTHWRRAHLRRFLQRTTG